MGGNQGIEISNDKREITYLVGLVVPGLPRAIVEEHLDELDRLVDTAGGEVVGRSTQERKRPDPATLVGRGFLHKLAETCEEKNVDALVFDEDLTASQARNIETEMPDSVKVLDRAAVILDIFAQRARSREAQTQVELAQLSYLCLASPGGGATCRARLVVLERVEWGRHSSRSTAGSSITAWLNCERNSK